MKTLRTKPVYKLYFRYKNITLWKNKTIDALTKKKWMLLKASKSSTLQYNRGIYLYHFKKLNLFFLEDRKINLDKYKLPLFVITNL